MNNETKNEAKNPKAPAFIAYKVREREGKKSFWTRIGCAWAQADGTGFNIQLDAIPLDGRIVLLPPNVNKD